MLFSSITFLYYFIPILIMIYFISPNKLKNLVLLVFSLVFYFFGEKEHILILIFSCIFNYIMGIIIEKHHKKCLLILDIVVNVLLLFYFKYTDFFISNINSLLNTKLGLLHVVMPVGISFFTFQTMSYVVDVYKKEVKASHNFINFACYVCMFPQLVAGPIVRYKEIEEKLKDRKHTFKNYSDGISRFIIGLSKKVILANSFSEAIVLVSDINSSVLSFWMKAIFYTMQIYFDFSGYSDMAIGLGKMFGFEFPENFNYPYIASSITSFWRRWHISLSSWLRDYVYIPLGGNRVSKLKWLRNVLVVWCITGFWHGASYNFILWGLYFAVFLIIEKLFLTKFLEKHKVFAHIYTGLIVIFSFVIFSNTDFKDMLINLKGMLFMNNIPLCNAETMYYFRSYLVLFIVSAICATPIIKKIYLKVFDGKVCILQILVLLVLLTLCTAMLIDTSYNPFLYYRF